MEPSIHSKVVNGRIVFSAEYLQFLRRERSEARARARARRLKLPLEGDPLEPGVIYLRLGGGRLLPVLLD